MTASCSLVQHVVRSLDRNLFRRLHPEGRRLITGWAQRGGGVPRDADASAYFEGFIYLWFALNGWAACVTGTDADRDWVEQVAGDEELGRLLEDAIRADSSFAARAREFGDLWPIFKSSEIRRRGIWVPQDSTRPQRVAIYLQNRIPFEPSCWLEHQDGRALLDWKHTFKTLYRVRCNLFHGEKTLDSENDRQIVIAAYPLLSRGLQRVGLIP